MQELFPFDQLPVFLRGGETEGDDGFKGVEQSVRVGKLEVQLLNVQFIQVKEVVQDG